jgi:hypothetical protein
MLVEYLFLTGKVKALSFQFSYGLHPWPGTSACVRVLSDGSIGLDGNILTRTYKQLGDLGTYSWFKILWQYSSVYKVKIEFSPKYLLGPTCWGKRPLVELLIEHGYRGVLLQHLNRFRKFHYVHSLADILCANGCSVDPAIFSTIPGHNLRTFSWEQPTSADFDA